MLSYLIKGVNKKMGIIVEKEKHNMKAPAYPMQIIIRKR
jgi:hypothetical protein